MKHAEVLPVLRIRRERERVEREECMYVYL